MFKPITLLIGMISPRDVTVEGNDSVLACAKLALRGDRVVSTELENAASFTYCSEIGGTFPTLSSAK